MSTHTPTPHLPLTVGDDGGWPILLDAYGEYVGKLATHKEAVLIVHCVNNFDALLALAHQYASECAECNGTGLVTIYNHDGHGSDADDQPCSQCADIRAVIAKVTP